MGDIHKVPIATYAPMISIVTKPLGAYILRMG